MLFAIFGNLLMRFCLAFSNIANSTGACLLADLGPCGLGFSFSPKKIASFVFLLLSFLFYFFSFADLRFITCVSATLQF